MFIANRWSKALLVTLGALATGACSVLDSSARGDVRVTLQQSDAVSSPALSVSDAGAGEDVAVRITRDMIASLDLRVTDIQFLPANQEENADGEGGWISLALAEPVTLDLLSLPAEGESPLVIAAGSVPVGSYRQVRLFTDEAMISFTGPITIGAAFTFEAGVPYPVETPSGESTGLKTHVAFTVEADAGGNVLDIQLLFSPSATFGNVTGTGSGRVLLAPVIRGQSSQP
jgi:hypothetical protein